MKKINFIILISLVCSFCSNGQISINKIDSLGHKNGIWREFKILPYTVIEENTLMDFPIDSTIKIIIDEYEFNKKSIIVESVGEYKSGLKDGEWVELFSNKKIKSEVEYSNGIPKGKCKLYYPNGELKMSCTIGMCEKVEISIYNENGCLKDKLIANRNDIILSIYQD